MVPGCTGTRSIRYSTDYIKLIAVIIIIYLLADVGNVYIADSFNHRIRKVTVSTDIITTIAGVGTSSYSGDNGAATSAALNYPCGVALDLSGTSYIQIIFSTKIFIFTHTGNVYISDTDNHRVRKVTTSTGVITTVAGTGANSYNGDNIAATSATLYYPRNIDVDVIGIPYYSSHPIYFYSLSILSPR